MEIRYVRLDENILKDSIFPLTLKLTSNFRYWHFLFGWSYDYSQNTINSLDFVDFFPQLILAHQT